MIKIFLLIGVLSFSFKSFSYVGAISTSTAGSGRAAYDMTEAPVANPAAIAYMKGYFFNTGYGTFINGRQFHVSLTDNLPDTFLPSTLQYVQENQKNPNTQQELNNQKVKFGIGNFMSRSFAMGFNLNHEIDTLSSSKHVQTNLSVGSLWAITPQIMLAAVFDNIVDSDEKVPQPYRLKPSTALGFSYNFKRFMRLRFDVETPKNSNSFSQPNYALGVESYWNRWIIVRLGTRKETQTKIDQYAAGLGFVGPKFALHYGYLQSPQDSKYNSHAIDLAVPIW